MLLGLLLLMFWLGSMGLISKLLGSYKLECCFGSCLEGPAWNILPCNYAQGMFIYGGCSLLLSCKHQLL
jgi:hypothetical protein